MSKKNGLFAFLTALLLASCIQDEALNAEADIETVTLPKTQQHLLNRDPIIENNRVKLLVKESVKPTDLLALAPEFTLTPGAIIEPASGTPRDFNQPQHYTVTSEDRQWSKTYEVSISYSGIPLEYQFETTLPYMENGELVYYNFSESDSKGNFLEWTNANAGFHYTGIKAAPEDYPTSPADNGVNGGRCIKLTTKSTGSLGALLGMYLAAGNLFMGSFSVSLPHVVKATKFGVPFTHIPKEVTGYYKYKSGPTFTSNNQIIAGKKDIFDIYGIFYETDEETKTLDGTNQFTHPNLISVARISDAHETDEWTRFSIPFEMRPGKIIDPVKLKEGKYNFALVFSSSIKGDLFEGAEGSTLYIDEVKVKIQE